MARAKAFYTKDGKKRPISDPTAQRKPINDCLRDSGALQSDPLPRILTNERIPADSSRRKTPDFDSYVPPPDEDYQGWSNWDTWNVMLLLDNDERTQRNIDAWAQNFNRKSEKGIFDESEARKAVWRYILPQAIKLDKAYGNGHSEIDAMKVNLDEIVDALLERGKEKAFGCD
jgi:hypothetical protein